MSNTEYYDDDDSYSNCDWIMRSRYNYSIHSSKSIVLLYKYDGYGTYIEIQLQ